MKISLRTRLKGKILRNLFFTFNDEGHRHFLITNMLSASFLCIYCTPCMRMYKYKVDK